MVMPVSRWNIPEPQVTLHGGLLAALSPVKFRRNWWEYENNGRFTRCLLCRHVQAQRLVWGTAGLEEHERQHVKALGVERVAAAEALRTMRITTTRSWNVLQWEAIIEDIWGCIPDVALPNITTDGLQK